MLNILTTKSGNNKKGGSNFGYAYELNSGDGFLGIYLSSKSLSCIH